MSSFLLSVAIVGMLLAGIGSASAQDMLRLIKERGYLICGSSQGLSGFSRPDSAGQWVGFDTDFCRALAAAIFNDPMRTRYVPLSAKDRLTALQSGEIDVLARTTTWTLSRDAGQGLNFTAVNYFDGQGFLVRRALGVASAKELNNASICVPQGTTNEQNVADFFRTNGLAYQVVTFQTVDEVASAYQAGRCDVLTTDLSQLASIRLTLANPDDHRLLPDVISKEPLGPWVRQGDDQWFDVVRWTLFAMLNAEELGITQGNVNQMMNSTNPEIRRLLGVEGKFGEALGLTSDWAARIIRAVGNYGESFERNLGSQSPMNMPRGLNQLWTKGGLQYAPPVR
jgi:general L-amino acid transport system substrate-binding protein